MVEANELTLMDFIDWPVLTEMRMDGRVEELSDLENRLHDSGRRAQD
jgi:hypothetical protein